MNFQDFENFVCLAECLNFTEAAKHLYISQSTLSRQIADLESQMGVKLFTRSKRTVDLTDEGKELLQLARTIVLNKDEFFRRAHQVHKGVTDVLSFGLPRFYEIDQIRQFFQLLPDGYFEHIDLTFHQQTAGALLNDLDSGRFDFVLVPSSAVDDLPNPNIQYLCISANTFWIVLSVEHPLAVRASLRISDLKDEEFVVLDKSEYPLEYKFFERMCRSEGIEPNVACITATPLLVMLYVLLGKGITFILAEKEVFLPEGLVSIPLEYELDDSVLNNVLAWRQDSSNPAVHRLVSVLKGGSARPLA